MPPDPNIPDAFDAYMLGLLRRPSGAPEMPEDELDDLNFPATAGAVGKRRTIDVSHENQVATGSISSIRIRLLIRPLLS